MKYNTESLAEEMKKSAYLWVGTTSNLDEYIALINFNSNLHKVIFKIEGDEVKITYHSDSDDVKDQILEMLHTALPDLIPEPDSDNIITSSSKKALPKVTVTEDLNKKLMENNIKSLPESMVIDQLNYFGDDISSYTYTSMSSKDIFTKLIDNPVPEGYENYPEEVLKLMANDESIAGYQLASKLEHTLYDLNHSHNKYNTAVISGAASVGKSKGVVSWCTRHKIPVLQTQYNAETTLADMKGEIQPVLTHQDVSKEVNKNANFRAILSKVLIAAEKGCWILIDEATLCRYLNYFLSITDGSGYIDGLDGEVIKVHENFRMVWTTNLSTYQGVMAMSPALISRVDTCYLEPISQEEMISRIMYDLGYTSNPIFLRKLVEVVFAFQDIYRSKGWYDVELVQRCFSRFLSKLDNHVTPFKEAFETCFVDALWYTDLTDPIYDKEQIVSITKPLIEELERVHEESLTGEVKVASYDVDLSQIDIDGSIENEEV